MEGAGQVPDTGRRTTNYALVSPQPERGTVLTPNADLFLADPGSWCLELDHEMLPTTAAAWSHSRTVVSAAALASSCPSGLNATDLTRSLWPVRVHQLWPAPGSHSFSGILLADFSYGPGQA